MRSLLTEPAFEAGKSFVDGAARMKLDTEWISHVRPGEPWIADRVTIYHRKLQDMPIAVNRSFDVVAYKDFNIPYEEWQSFFERLSEVVKLDGIVAIQFWLDEYDSKNKDGYLESCIDSFFRSIEFIIDEIGNEHEGVPNKRFVLLRDPIAS